MNKPVFYALSGLGADHRVFSRLEAAGVSLKHVAWKPPFPRESLRAYASRLLEDLPTGPVSLLGLSFGGLVVQEMAAIRPVEHLVLLSTLRTPHERPGWMSWAGKLSLDRVVPLKSYRWMEPIQNRNLGVTSREPALLELVREYRRQVDPTYLSWAVGQVLRWQGSPTAQVTGTVFRFHGQQDRLFPNVEVHSDDVLCLIPDGGHLLVFTHATEVARQIC